MNTVTNEPGIVGKDTITKAAQTARALFLLNEWTWRGDKTPPTQFEIEVGFTTLQHAIENAHGFDAETQTRFATSGRLMAVRPTGSESFYFSVVV